MRLDTYIHNVPANVMYPRLGYRFAAPVTSSLPGLSPLEVLQLLRKAPVIPPFPPDVKTEARSHRLRAFCA